MSYFVTDRKIYLWDYGGIADEAARFENLVASHLLTARHYCTDRGEGNFELRFLRNEERREIDFLLARDGVPWLPVAVKLADDQPSSSWGAFASHLPCSRGLQVVRQPTWRIHRYDGWSILVAGAAEALDYFV